MEEIDRFFYDLYRQVNTGFSFQPWEVRFIVLNFAAIGAGIFFGILYRSFQRKLAALLFGLLLHFLMFKAEMLYPLLFVIANYAILYATPANVFTYTIGFDLLVLLSKHLVDAFFGTAFPVYVNGVVMFFALKSIALASNIHDSTRRSEILDREKVQRILFGRPRLFDYLSYHYFFPTCFWGPFIEYDDFVEFIARRGKFKDTPALVGRMLMTIVYLVGFLLIIGAIWLFGIPFMIERNGDTIFMLENDIIGRISFYIFSGILERFKRYYLILTLIQMALNTTGIGIIEEKTDRGTQQMVHRDSISATGWLAELELHPKRFFRGLNPSYSFFVREYLQEQLIRNKYSKSVSDAMILAFTSIWIGADPAVIVILFFGMMYENAYERISSQHFGFWSRLPGYSRTCFHLVLHALVINGLSVCFQMNMRHLILNFLSSVHYIPLLLIAGTCTFSTLIRKTEKPQLEGPRHEAVEISDETQHFLELERIEMAAKRLEARQKYLAELQKKNL